MEDKIKELGLLLGKANKLFEEIQNPAEIKFEIGRWYYRKWNKDYNHEIDVFRCDGVLGSKASHDNFIRFFTDGRSVESYKMESFIPVYDKRHDIQCRLATEEEIKQALIAEASRRGFKKGVKIKELECVVGVNRFDTPTSDRFEYRYPKDRLCMYGDNNGIAIYNEGKWAEIVKEAQLTFGGNPVTIDGNKITCKGVTGTYEQLKEIYDEIKRPIEFKFGSSKLEQVKWANNTTSRYDLAKSATAQEVKIGCSWGTVEEIKAILEAVEEHRKGFTA